MKIITREMLERVAVPLPKEEIPTPSTNGKKQSGVRTLADFITEHGIETRPSYSYDDGTAWELKQCPFCQEHKGAVLIEKANGARIFTCRHNRCDGKRWEDFRRYYEPDTKVTAPKPIPFPSREACKPTTVQEAIQQQNMPEVLRRAREFALLQSLEQARLKVQIMETFGTKFPMRQFEALVREERADLDVEQKRKPAIKSARDLMAQQFAEVKWIVAGILPPGLIALAGKQKLGKSWLDYHLSIAVSSGGMAFGSIPVEEGDVLYMALEDNDRRVQSRLGTCLSHFDMKTSDMPARLDVVTEWPRMNAAGLLALEDWINSKPNPRLIIVDPWVKVKPRVPTRAGETGYDADYEALEGLKQLADKYQVCILVQFHLRKEPAEDRFDELNGTSGITACADGFLSLKRPRGEKLGTLWGTGRDYEQEVNLAVEFDEALWTIVGDAETVAHGHASQEVLDVLIAENKPMFAKQIASILGRPEGTIRKRLFDMKVRGEVDDTGHGYAPVKNAAHKTGNASNAQQYEKATQANLEHTPLRYPLTPQSNALQYNIASDAELEAFENGSYVTQNVTQKSNGEVTASSEHLSSVTSQHHVTQSGNAVEVGSREPVESNDIAERYFVTQDCSEEIPDLTDHCAYCDGEVAEYSPEGIAHCVRHAQEKGNDNENL